MQRNPFGTYDNSVPVADCSLVEERAAFEALFPRGRAVRDTLVGLRIALCTGGAAQIEVDGRRYDFREGGVLCLTPPSRLVRVVSLSTGFRLRMLSFTFDFLAGQPFLLRASVSEVMERTPCIEPDDEARRSLTGLFDFLRMQLGRDAFPSRREAVEALLFILIAEASHLYDREPVSLRRTRAEEIADGFFALLHRHFRRGTAWHSTPPGSASPRSTSSAPSGARPDTRPHTGLPASACARPTCCSARPT